MIDLLFCAERSCKWNWKRCYTPFFFTDSDSLIDYIEEICIESSQVKRDWNFGEWRGKVSSFYS